MFGFPGLSHEDKSTFKGAYITLGRRKTPIYLRTLRHGGAKRAHIETGAAANAASCMVVHDMNALVLYLAGIFGHIDTLQVGAMNTKRLSTVWSKRHANA